MCRKRDENDEALIKRAQKRMLELNQLSHFSDFTFTVQDEQFFVSKIVLFGVSPYFKNKFDTEWRISGLKEQVLEHLPSAVNGLKSPQGIYCLVSDHYISDSELGEVFVAAVADNIQDMEAFEDLDRVKLFLVKMPQFAADLISEPIKRRISKLPM